MIRIIKPGMVIRIPAVRGTRLLKVDFCYTGTCDATDLKAGKKLLLITDDLRRCGTLIGTKYRAK